MFITGGPGKKLCAEGKGERGGFNTNFTHSDILEPCTLIHFGWWEISIENQNVWGREILVSSIFVGLCSLSMCTYSDVVGVI